MKPKTLFEYYNQKGESLPSVQDRATLASKLGISGYTGTKAQNTQLLGLLTQGNGSMIGPTQVNAPVNSNVIDISNIETDVPPVPMSSDPFQVGGTSFSIDPTALVNTPTTTVVRSVDNADGTTTNFLSDGTSETGRYSRNTDGTFTFTPLSGKDVIGNRISTLKDEVATLEDSIARRTANRNTALEQGGVFDDTRKLNELKAELRKAEDQGIEIPIEARRELRGRGATLTEFDQVTGPQLERNALRTLTASRGVSALADTINTNIAIIDQNLKAQNEIEDQIYTKKTKELENVEKIYGDILTEEEKNKLEDRKFQNELALGTVKWENELKADFLKKAVEKGATPADIARISTGSLQDIMNFSASVKDPKQTQADVIAEQASIDIINTVNDLLADTEGLENSVGPNWLSRVDFGRSLGGDETGVWRGKATNLLSEGVLNKITELKERGTSLGALSTEELKLLQNASSTLINSAKVDKNGKLIGTFDLPETAFKTLLSNMKVPTMRMYILDKIGIDKYLEGNWKNADAKTLETAFKLLSNAKIGGTAGTPSAFERDFGTASPTTSFIGQEEGFRENAYQDSTGKWTIGYGATQINGRPVRAGDVISKNDADQLLAQDIARHSNYKNLVTASLTPTQEAALASFEYNLGPNVWNQTTGKQIINAINRGDLTTAGNLMLQFNKALNPATGQREVLQGLADRRGREVTLLTRA